MLVNVDGPIMATSLMLGMGYKRTSHGAWCWARRSRLVQQAAFATMRLLGWGHLLAIAFSSDVDPQRVERLVQRWCHMML